MGRPTGAANKNKQALLAALRAKYGEGFDPVMKMAEHAMNLSEASELTEDPNDHKMALDGWDKVAVYVTPKLKAIEHSGGEDEDGLPQSIKIEIVKSGA